MQANKEITTHQKNLQVLMVEVFKTINSIAPEIKDCFFSSKKILIIFGTFK